MQKKLEYQRKKLGEDILVRVIEHNTQVFLDDLLKCDIIEVYCQFTGCLFAVNVGDVLKSASFRKIFYRIEKFESLNTTVMFIE